MGANTFSCVGRGDTPLAAFRDAQERARQYSDGEEDEGGYEGDVRAKRGFTPIAIPEDFRASFVPRFNRDSVEGAYADALIETCDPRVDDKYGPAGCIALDGGHYLFFGWASA